MLARKLEEKDSDWGGEIAESGPMIKKTEPVVSLTGYLIPWDLATDAPVLLELPGSDMAAMPLFKSSVRLHGTMTNLMGPNFFYKVKSVDNGDEFLDEVLGSGVIIILDPFFLPNGKLRFFEVSEEGK